MLALDPTEVVESSSKYYSTRPDSNLEKIRPILNFTRPRLDSYHSNTRLDSAILNFNSTRPDSNLEKTRPILNFTRPRLDSYHSNSRLDSAILYFNSTRPDSNLEKTQPRFKFTRRYSTYMTQTLDCIDFLCKWIIIKYFLLL